MFGKIIKITGRLLAISLIVIVAALAILLLYPRLRPHTGNPVEVATPPSSSFHSAGAIALRGGLQIYHRLTTVCGKGEAALAAFPIEEINPLMLQLASGGLRAWSRAGPKSCARLQADEKRLFRITAALHQAGVPLALGSDSGPHLTLSGRSVLDELQLLVAAGLSRDAALACATVQAARVLRQPQLGRIAPGFLADAILLDADPRQNLTTLATPHAVLSRGVWFDGQARQALLQRATQHADRVLTAGRLLEAAL